MSLLETVERVRESLERNGTGLHRAAAARPAAAIDRIADNRMADMGHMDADLMGASGLQPAFDQRGAGNFLFAAPQRPDDPVVGFGLFTAARQHRHFFPVLWTAPNIALNHALRFLRHPPHHRLIGTVDAVRGELGRQMPVRRVVFGGDD